MATDEGGGAAEAVHEAPNRPALLELFFDLAFIFVLIALAGGLCARLTWAGAGQTLSLLLAFALLWALTSWAGDLLSPALLLPRVLGVMVGVLLMGATATDAYGPRGLLFAVTYVTAHLGTGLYMLLLGPPALRVRTLRIFFWFAASGVLWIIGGVVPASARGVLWAVAIVLEYAGALLGWPAPGSWRPLPRHNQRLVGERISERYRQFVIIALGASIYVTGNAFTQSEHTIGHAQALVVVFMTKVVIWRIYIHRAGELMATAIVNSADPIRLSQLTAFLHLIMVAGIVGTAATSKLVVHRPFGNTPGSWTMVILGSPALFLIGRVLLGYLVLTRINWALLAGLLLLACLAPATTLLPPVALALVVLVILVGAATANVVEDRHRPPTPAARHA